MKTAVTELLGIEYPIFQGGMAWVAEHHLAAAVSNAGGLGIIASGGAPCEAIREEVRKTRELTEKPFGLNVMLIESGGRCHCPHGGGRRRGRGDDRGRKSGKIFSSVERSGH